MTKPLLLFDFDGTIADSFPQFVLAFNHELERRGMKPVINTEPYRALSTKEILRSFRVRWYQFPFIVRRVRAFMIERLHDAKPHKGMVATLKALHKKYRIGVATTNDAKAVRSYLDAHNIPCDLLVGNIGLFGKGRALKRLAKREGPIVGYVGDEVRDMKAAQKARVRTIAVSWGYNTPATLKALSPDVFVTNAKELLQL